jgi:hypothetical protein
VTDGDATATNRAAGDLGLPAARTMGDTGEGIGADAQAGWTAL